VVFKNHFLAVLLALPWLPGGDSPMLVMSPYLQAVTPTSVYVLAESMAEDPVTVQCGTSEAFGIVARTESIRTTTGGSFVHAVKVEGLTPDTRYVYRAIQGTDTSAIVAFRSAVLPGTPFRFAWMADCRSGTAVHDSIAARILQANPVVSLYGGDLSPTPSYPAYKSNFFRPWERGLIGRVPFFNAPGNHEGWDTNTVAFTHAPPSASGVEAYYSFDYGDMHVLVLNTQLPCDIGTAQYQFVKDDISATKRTWRIVIAHDHAYCVGGHGENNALKTMTTNIFEPGKVDLVLSGHSHFYQHNLVNGIHHMIIGSAGAPLYDPGRGDYTLNAVKDYNFAIGDVTPTTLRLVVYNHRGETLDSLFFKKPATGDSERNR
jgi:3',5'-cyclic AMP phosphodiesterase CpdA